MTGSLGAAVRRLRVEAGLSQDDLARRAREYGLNWTTPRVSELERDELRISLPVLLVVAAALSTAGGHAREIRVRDLLDERESVPITAKWSMGVDELARFISGDYDAMSFGSFNPDSERSEPDTSGILEALRLAPPGITAREAAALDGPPSTLAERRAAKRIGVPVSVVRMWAHHLWGKPLDARAAEVAGSESAQARGHATRGLVAELQLAIKGAADA
ncbi:helix-turn-helix domain-containing protein [Microbacterium sp. NPDC078428]|uniref:helix-turn-helix domain-containing protein n=1 Tax=Microbacterium sp. NPDC078428 TaxID=3364190 RepID=UPI0037C77FF7